MTPDLATWKQENYDEFKASLGNSGPCPAEVTGTVDIVKYSTYLPSTWEALNSILSTKKRKNYVLCNFRMWG